jgi:hypothetical protein
VSPQGLLAGNSVGAGGEARDSPIRLTGWAADVALARNADIPAIRFSGNFGRQPTVQDSCAHQILSALRGAVPI